MRQFAGDYVRGLGMAARNNALAYGYSIVATAGFGLLTATAGPASVGRIFWYVLGNGLSFASANALVTRGYKQRVEHEPPVVMALATSFSALSISAAAGAAALIGWWLGDWGAWLLGAAVATWVYLSLAALEVAVARALHVAVSDEPPENR